MNSAPHLLNEDRQEFTRILDEALRSAPHRRDLQDLTAADSTLTAEQLRSMALSAMVLIAATAAAEYQHYVRLRGELRTPPRAARASGGTSAARPVRTGRPGAVRGAGHDRAGLALGPAGAEPGEPAGAGLAAVIAVLAPVLSGAAALIFLLVGYVLEMVGPAPAIADTLRTTGWVFGAITAAGILVAAVGLLLAALRNSATSLRAEDHAVLDAELDRACEAWHQALLERGILPFLQEALVRSSTDRTSTTRTQQAGRMPHLGYHSPGFSSPDGGPTAAPRPRYSSPDFSSPDFGGPEHQPE